MSEAPGAVHVCFLKLTVDLNVIVRSKMSLLSWMTGTGGGGGLQTSGNLDRDKFIQFAKACTDQFESPDFVRELRTAVQQKKDPEDLIEVMQFKEFEKIGIQGHFGVGQLRHIQTKFKDDMDVMSALIALMKGEEGCLDKVQLSPEALEAKEKSTEELMKIQWALRNCAAALPQDQQMQFATDFEAAMKSAEKQVPKKENATPEEAVAAAREQMRCACVILKSKGYTIPDDVVPPMSAQGVDGAVAAPVGSSVMTAEEQERFLSNVGRS